MVQAVHAGIEAGAKFGADVKDTNLVILETDNEDTLKDKELFLQYMNIDYVIFFEPDVNGFTAICTQPVSKQQKKLFQNEKMMVI